MEKKITLIFDLDDTLYDRAQPFEKAIEEATGRKLEGDIRKCYSIYSRHSQEMFEANVRGELSLEESHIFRIRYAAEELGIPMTEEQEREYQKAYEKAQGKITLSRDMEELLDYCARQKIPVGILTNGPVKNQKRKIQVLGLEKWIPEEMTFISEGIGYKKPDVEAFHYVEKVLHTAPDELCMIGDSYSSDIVGAKKAGWETIWLDKNRTEIGEAEKMADLIVNTEEELLKRIKRA